MSSPVDTAKDAMEEREKRLRETVLRAESIKPFLEEAEIAKERCLKTVEKELDALALKKFYRKKRVGYLLTLRRAVLGYHRHFVEVSEAGTICSADLEELHKSDLWNQILHDREKGLR